MPKKPVKETIHAKGVDITIYTEDFQNEFISLTDIAHIKAMNLLLLSTTGCGEKIPLNF